MSRQSFLAPPRVGRLLRRITGTIAAVAAAAALSGCASPAQEFRDSAKLFGQDYSLAEDKDIDVYGETACDGGREALGRLLSAESDENVDTIYLLATSAYCPPE